MKDMRYVSTIDLVEKDDDTAKSSQVVVSTLEKIHRSNTANGGSSVM